MVVLVMPGDLDLEELLETQAYQAYRGIQVTTGFQVPTDHLAVVVDLVDLGHLAVAPRAPKTGNNAHGRN